MAKYNDASLYAVNTDQYNNSYLKDRLLIPVDYLSWNTSLRVPFESPNAASGDVVSAALQSDPNYTGPATDIYGMLIHGKNNEHRVYAVIDSADKISIFVERNKPDQTNFSGEITYIGSFSIYYAYPNKGPVGVQFNYSKDGKSLYILSPSRSSRYITNAVLWNSRIFAHRLDLDTAWDVTSHTNGPGGSGPALINSSFNFDAGKQVNIVTSLPGNGYIEIVHPYFSINNDNDELRILYDYRSANTGVAYTVNMTYDIGSTVQGHLTLTGNSNPFQYAGSHSSNHLGRWGLNPDNILDLTNDPIDWFKDSALYWPKSIPTSAFHNAAHMRDQYMSNNEEIFDNNPELLYTSGFTEDSNSVPNLSYTVAHFNADYAKAFAKFFPDYDIELTHTDLGINLYKELKTPGWFSNGYNTDFGDSGGILVNVDTDLTDNHHVLNSLAPNTESLWFTGSSKDDAALLGTFTTLRMMYSTNEISSKQTMNIDADGQPSAGTGKIKI